MEKAPSGIKKVTLAGLIVTLGIVYGDIGTSPLYVMNAIMKDGRIVNEMLIYGALSCIFWTLTLQTTFKYVIITLQADNHGEGGIFALFALVRRKTNLIAIITMLGGSALLADGVITPAITVTSAIEGLNILYTNIPVVPIVLSIFLLLFFFQQFGSGLIGRVFGPVMFLWFLLLAILGISQLSHGIGVMAAMNPYYAYQFLSTYPHAIILLGAVFLATTGAEALYSDLGHCGIKNIRITWFFVKVSLLLNYFGQGAWLLDHMADAKSVNVFYSIMPQWFLIPGIIIATSAAVIASQALISGSYTLISEAISLNVWPRIKVLYPTSVKGQVYIPFVNWLLWIACSFVVIYFTKSSNMEAAYGLSITITMIMTTLLLSVYLAKRKVNLFIRAMLLVLFLTIELTFLYANLHKFVDGGWLTILLAALFFTVMYGWYFGRKIKNKFITFTSLKKETEVIYELSMDYNVPKIATNLVYITKANALDQIEAKIMYSIFNKHPKRANTYWFLHIDSLDTPDTFEYTVHHIVPGVVIKVEFHLGFKVERRINVYFKQVLEDLEKTHEISMVSHYKSLKRHSIPADFLFVNLDRVLINDYKLPPLKRFTMGMHNFIRRMGINDVKAFGLDTSNVIEEKIPIVIAREEKKRIKRLMR
ncbi:MAG: KUP/HAK/KT family potassium transporter [Prolixibacteraceae bacterium]|jgi:KUP system potassium uptake protein|nr:KUP/HAK/KT family potassium transporter [Prolixibacteraceae bacterium]